jgi:hypothetical protein
MEQAIPILPADDLALAMAFYVDGLGFRVLFEASEDGRSGLLGLERGTIRLTLDSPMDGHGRNACVRSKSRMRTPTIGNGARRSTCCARPATRSGTRGRSTCWTRSATPSS